MASLYKRKDSPCWWLRMKVGGVWVCKNTGLRLDSALDTKRAKILREERSAQESVGHAMSDLGWTWVRAFLQSSAPSPLTRDAYALRWRHISDFLLEYEIVGPASVRHEHAQEYIVWRTGQKRHSGKPISRNTAVMEVKTWKSIMMEAVNRGIMEYSPLVRAKLFKDPPAEKPEITADEQKAIESALKAEPRWMQRSWAVAMATGCRLRETRIEIHNVDLARAVLHFPSPKGGRKKAYSIPLPHALRPMFEDMKSKRQSVTLEFPFQPSRQWGLFFARVGVSHLCFHCTRVTFISRLARAGAPLSVAMRLVNHASTAIHRIYQRVNMDDLSGWSEKVSQTLTGAIAQNPSAKSGARRKGTPAKRK